MHVEPPGPDDPPGPDGATEAVVGSAAGPADRRRAHHLAGRAEVVAAVAVWHVVQLPGARRRPGRQLGAAAPAAAPAARCSPPTRTRLAAARTHLGRVRATYERRDRGGVAEALRASVIEHLRIAGQPRGAARFPDELLSGDARIDATLHESAGAGRNNRAQRGHARPARLRQRRRVHRGSSPSRGRTMRVRPQLQVDAAQFAEFAGLAGDDLVSSTRRTAGPVRRHDPAPVPAVGAGPGSGARRAPGVGHRASSPLTSSSVAAFLLRRTPTGRTPTPGRRQNGTSPRRRPPSWRPRPPAVRFRDRHRQPARDPASLCGRARRARHVAGSVRAQPHRRRERSTSSRGSPWSTGPGPTPVPITGRRSWTSRRPRPTHRRGSVRRAQHQRPPAAVPARPVRGGRLAGVLRGGRAARAAGAAGLQAVTVPYPGAWPSLQPLRIVVERRRGARCPGDRARGAGRGPAR